MGKKKPETRMPRSDATVPFLMMRIEEPGEDGHLFEITLVFDKETRSWRAALIANPNSSAYREVLARVESESGGSCGQALRELAKSTDDAAAKRLIEDIALAFV
jgi:hypothetical protein